MHALWSLTLLLLDLIKLAEGVDKIKVLKVASRNFREVLPRSTLYIQYFAHIKAASVDKAVQ